MYCLFFYQTSPLTECDHVVPVPVGSGWAAHHDGSRASHHGHTHRPDLTAAGTAARPDAAPTPRTAQGP